MIVENLRVVDRGITASLKSRRGSIVPRNITGSPKNAKTAHVSVRGGHVGGKSRGIELV
jgi:hypothetical protein